MNPFGWHLLPSRKRNSTYRPSLRLLLAGIGALTSCATVPKDAGFNDVGQLATSRTGFIVQWNGHTTDDQAVAAKVHDLLAAPLTADEAAQIALLNNRHLQATFEDLGIAQADLVQAGLLKNPVFDIGVRFPDRAPSGVYLDIAAAEDFLDIALIPARKKLVQDQFNEAKAKVSDEILSLASQARSAFYTYQAARQMVDLQKTIAEAAAAAFEAAKKLHDAGNLNDLDFTVQRAQDVRARVDLAGTEADAVESRQRVDDLMGVWGSETNWQAADRLPDVPPNEIAPDNSETLALRQRQDLAAARQEVFVQAKMLGLNQDFRFSRQVDLGPEFERETDGQWRIGPTLSVSIPLFDQGQAKIARAVAMLRQSVDRYEAMKVDVRCEVNVATARLLSARSKALLYRDQVMPIEQDLVRLTQLQYNGMFVGVFQLLEARRDQINSAREYLNALRDYWIARAELERAVGGCLMPIVPSTLPAISADPGQTIHPNGAMP